VETKSEVRSGDGGAVPEVPGLQISGSVGLDQDGVIRALVKGDVRSSNKLVVARDSVVSGWVQARDIRLEGRVDGGIEGTGRVWLTRGSILRTRCVAKELRIDPGAIFAGELRVGE